jgi:hypothetical protein
MTFVICCEFRLPGEAICRRYLVRLFSTRSCVSLPADREVAAASNRATIAASGGLFYGCKGGAEARGFNSLLIDAGLIQGL